MTLQSLGIPFLLGSFWALLPALVVVAAMAIRTALQDRMLHAELPGYQEYAQEVPLPARSGHLVRGDMAESKLRRQRRGEKIR